MGHQVLTVSVPSRRSEPDHIETFVGYSSRTRVEELQEHFGPIDLFLYVEPLGLIPEGMERAPFITAAVLCDMHNNLPSRLRLAKFFDHLFVYQRNYLEVFTEHPTDHVHWMPFACDTEVVRPIEAVRDLDVAFVGKLVKPTHERWRITQRIAQRWRLNPQEYCQQADIPKVYSRAKIVINLPLKDDLNFRTFEAMSCGAMLLTRRVCNGQELLFEEGQHYAAFATEEELFAKIDYYLAHEQESAQIAAAGLSEVRAKHTLELRLEQLLKTVKERGGLAAPIRRMPLPQVDSLYAAIYSQWWDATAGWELVREAKKQGRPWQNLVLPAMRTVLRFVLR
jgi:hypothetical protein